MNTIKIPAASIQPGMQVVTTGGLRTVTSVGPYTSFKREMFGWKWTPAVREDGRMDCGYSGICVQQADVCMVEVAA